MHVGNGLPSALTPNPWAALGFAERRQIQRKIPSERNISPPFMPVLFINGNESKIIKRLARKENC
jgi:hypothetical protein